MRIAIDVRKLHDFGVGTYVRNLLRQLARLDHDTEYVLLSRPDDRDLAGELGANFRVVPEAAGQYTLREQLSVPIRLGRAAPNLFHTPHYVLPVLTPCRSIVTIHDCIHLIFPQYLPGRLSYAYARAMFATAVRRASRILTVSEASKSDILRFFDVPGSKVTVIHNAIDERFHRQPPEEEIVRVRERYQLHDRFLMYAGNVQPHKNLERLIGAFVLLRQEGLDDLKLLITGQPGLPLLHAAAGRAPVQPAQARAVPGLPVGDDARGALPAGRRLRLPVPLRGVRPAPAGGHGQRDAGGGVQRLVAPGGGRRRRGSWSTPTTPGPSPTASGRR